MCVSRIQIVSSSAEVDWRRRARIPHAKRCLLYSPFRYDEFSAFSHIERPPQQQQQSIRIVAKRLAAGRAGRWHSKHNERTE